jgi:hypothetical protein
MLSANVPHTAYLTPGFSVSDWIASTRKPRTALDGKGATNCAAEVHAQAGEHAGWLYSWPKPLIAASGDSPEL